jgi:phage N-6-adenine-methyltransferase
VTKQGFYTSQTAFSSATDDWATPLGFYRRLHAEFGFVLDVCASKTNKKTSAYYGLDHRRPARRDGLACDWVAEAAALGGAVWLNPPYGDTISKWMAKAAEVAAAGATVVCLVPARTDTGWWHDSVMTPEHEVRLVRGRLKFGSGKGSAPFPSAVVVMRPEPSRIMCAMQRV